MDLTLIALRNYDGKILKFNSQELESGFAPKIVYQQIPDVPDLFLALDRDIYDSISSGGPYFSRTHEFRSESTIMISPDVKSKDQQVIRIRNAKKAALMANLYKHSCAVVGNKDSYDTLKKEANKIILITPTEGKGESPQFPDLAKWNNTSLDNLVDYFISVYKRRIF